MRYTDLTIHQRISLKGLFQTDKDLSHYYAAMLLFGFRKAVEYFLNEDIAIFNS
jgi:hypothetical protein